VVEFAAATVTAVVANPCTTWSGNGTARPQRRHGSSGTDKPTPLPENTDGADDPLRL
jgi:hypothetical protein